MNLAHSFMVSKRFVHAAPRRLTLSSGVGLALGALFFAAALTPTLVPRSYLTQGSLAGACFAIGYGAGVFWRWLWHHLPSSRIRTITNALVAVAILLVVITFLWRAAEWQNSIRAVMTMEPVETARPLKICAIALITFFALPALARLFRLVTHFLSAHIRLVLRRTKIECLWIVVDLRTVRSEESYESGNYFRVR
jgi:uncharacterized membrane protein